MKTDSINSKNHISEKITNPLPLRVASVLRAERDMLSILVEHIEGSGWPAVKDALNALNEAKGRIVITGMGKSGHIGRKIAATMSSLGAPTFFVHPAEASHGDLGMITERDAVIALSNSGNTAEIRDIILYSKSIDIPVIAITMGKESFLAKNATHPIFIPKVPEGCSLGLAPTTSTTAQLAIGDALSVGLSVMRDFTRDGFNRFHPGGALGQSTSSVREHMHPIENTPIVSLNAKIPDIIWEMAQQGADQVGVVNADGNLQGIIYAKEISPTQVNFAKEIMRTPEPIISPDDSIATAKSRMSLRAGNSILVVENQKPVGIFKG